MTAIKAWMFVLVPYLALSGCYSVPSRSDASSPVEPWCGSSQRAHAYHEVRSDGAVVRTDTLYWRCAHTADDSRVDAVQVANECTAFLRSIRIDHQPTVLHEDGTLWPYQNYRGRDQAPAAMYRFAETASIVCIDPVIVVLVPIPLDVHTRTLKDTNLLELGYLRSTRMPYHPEVRWFSPTLGVGPSEPALVREGDASRRRISVPWGSLLLARDRDQWVVSTELGTRSAQTEP